jgi:hypothetical protein
MAALVNSFEALWDSLRVHGPTPQVAEEIARHGQHGDPSLEGCLLQAELARIGGESLAALQIANSLGEQTLERAKNDQPRLASLFFHRLGLLQREQSQFKEAACAFLEAMKLAPSQLESLHALQFTKLDDIHLSELMPELEELLRAMPPAARPLASQLLADWQFRLGERENSLIRSFHAAQQSVPAQYHHSIDTLSPPSLPEALIIGAPKSGTTSLAAWLSGHPQIYVHPRKELHFFDTRWERGENWYRCQFPTFKPSQSPITRLEATPNYLQLPEIPVRVASLMPQARLIVILRHPVDRALSWYHHIVRQEGITEPAATIFSQELDELEALSKDGHSAIGWHGTNCLAGSFYSAQLSRWRAAFPPAQLLVLQMEAVLEHPKATWETIEQFLGLTSSKTLLPTDKPLPRLNHAPGTYASLESSLRRRAELLLKEDILLWESLQGP